MSNPATWVAECYTCMEMRHFACYEDRELWVKEHLLLRGDDHSIDKFREVWLP